jgi:ABC-type antimicrobial peptide transport system permease subunit
MPTIRAIVVEEVPSLGIESIETRGAIRRADRRGWIATVLAPLGGGLGLALFLSAIGLYAVIAFSVRQRTSEIAVRVAVGARARQIVAALLGDGLRLAGIGSALGLPASLLILWVIRSDPDMARVTPQHVIALTALAVFLVATAATWIPARRAAAIHPAVALRGD